MSPRPNWTFITNHGAVLVLLNKHGMITAREIAQILGITVRSVRRIISELETEGYIQITKQGRRNIYSINYDKPLRRGDQRTIEVGTLLNALDS
jgi:predicted transcriptional regulator of viral defense system